MKEVVAIIRMNRMNRTKAALVEAGFPAFTAAKVMGRGKKPLDQALLEELARAPEDSADVLPIMAQGPRLMPKRMIKLVVPDSRVEEAVKTIVSANRSGNPGDGKIFVLPVWDVARIRTGETGRTAIDEMDTQGR